MSGVLLLRGNRRCQEKSMFRETPPCVKHLLLRGNLEFLSSCSDKRGIFPFFTRLDDKFFNRCDQRASVYFASLIFTGGFACSLRVPTKRKKEREMVSDPD